MSPPFLKLGPTSPMYFGALVTALPETSGSISSRLARLSGWPIERPPMLKSRAIAASILASATLSRHRSSQTRLEAMPMGAQEVLSCVTDPDLQIIPFVAVVQRDPAVVGEIIRVANSILYRGHDQVSSPKDAVIRLGLEEACRIAAVVASRALFRARSESLYALRPAVWDELTHHSLCTAYGSAWLCRQLRAAEPGLAFLAGLFHNIGSVVALHVLLPLVHAGGVPIEADDEICHLVCDRIHHELGPEQLLYFNMAPEIVSVCIHAADLDLPAEPAFRLHHVIRAVAGLLALQRQSFENLELSRVLAQSLAALALSKETTGLLYREMASLADKVRIILNLPAKPTVVGGR
ncbi:MAG: HDOD domain-containing protein [Deltaproteobacteria bacterium]|nr:HDOD domain-containing protein [Deltaproteobacteria bacterium]